MALENLDDKDLIHLALSGKQEGYTRLLLKYKDQVQAYITKMAGPSGVAEDLVLISFDKAFSNLDHYNPHYAFSTWLYNIAQNVCFDYLRRQRYSFIPLEEVKEPAADTPEEGYIAEQQQEIFLKHLKALKPIYREVAQLRYLEDFAYEDIADKLGIPIGTVKARLHRARAMLNEMITGK